MTCYACDAEAVGQADHDGKRKAACARHANPSLPKVTACIYCDGTVRAGWVDVGFDGPRHLAHAKCHREATAY